MDRKYEWFAKDARNIRLGLASDGFNPFGMQNVTYTTWHVILIPYNLPPWLFEKQPYWMMSMLIPSKKSPGMNIDVYLRPLIDELKELWEKGIDTWDDKVKKNLNYMLFCFGQLMAFLHMRCFLVGAQKANLHVHTATRIHIICG